MKIYYLPNGFKWINGYENRFAINENGDVYSSKIGRLRKISVICREKQNPYLAITLKKNKVSKTFHLKSLVFMEFINRNVKPKLTDLIHKDGNFKNCSVKNLLLLRHNSILSKKLICKKDKICFFSVNSAGDFYNIHPGTISRYCKKKQNTFEYIEEK